MASKNEEIDLRKVEIRDTISSFDRLVLPVEYKPDIYNRIDRAQSERPSEEWTIPEDLPGTLMQWGVHDENCWRFLNQCQSPYNRARLFHEKLGRRFDKEFLLYNHLPTVIRDGRTVDLAVPEIRDAVQKISEEIRRIVVAAQQDRQTRKLGEDGTARQLLKALTTICNSHEDVSHIRRSVRRSVAGGEPEVSLYQTLISGPISNGSNFMLEVLEQISTSVLFDLKTELQAISRLLKLREAPGEYQTRFESILKKVAVDSPPIESAPEPSTGSKRAAIADTGRRGKRKIGT